MTVSRFTFPRSTRRAGAEALVLLSKRRTWFTPDGDESGNEGGEGGSSEEKKLLQSEVDKLIGKTRTDTRKSAQQETTAEILKRLGVEKLEDAEAVLKAAREKAEGEKTELQKALDAQATLVKERDDAKNALKTFQESVDAEKRLTKRNAAVTKAAAAAKALDADDVITWAEKYSDAELAKVLKEDGTVDEKAAEALVLACKTARPNYFGLKSSVPGTGSHSGGARPDPNRRAENQALANAKRAVRNRM